MILAFAAFLSEPFVAANSDELNQYVIIKGTGLLDRNRGALKFNINLIN